MKFKSLQKTHPIPFVIYADLEAILQLLTGNKKKEGNESYTIKTHEYITNSYGYKVVCQEDDKYRKPYKSYLGLGEV